LLGAVAVGHASILVQLVDVSASDLVAVASVVEQPTVRVRDHIVAEGTAVPQRALSRCVVNVTK